MRILFVGDVVGRPGRDAVAALLPGLRDELRVDLAIVNGENAAGGAGLTAAIARELQVSGADVITTGNHVWDQRQFMSEIESLDFVLRPINLPANNPGRGWLVAKGVLVVNAIGRTFMAPADDPFRAMDELLTADQPRLRVLDWHAEASSEKLAMGWHLDGRATAVVGSHTHVPTADARVLPNGTALVCDTGMVGPRDSILGMRADVIVDRFRTGLPKRFEVADGQVAFGSVLIDADDETGKAHSIERVDRLHPA
ncbi:MAG: 2,3-cyclic-nucleotide 2-phosphodiesterase [Chloroflexota bacterium]|jgi:metallophosphoesterase (TIGR00282 family)|nr:2,3-cyclic-nucleotide 2-phosphodiesterase [Chloroflexota bacterium]